VHKQVNVVVFAVHRNKFCLEIGADLGKDGAKSVDSISVQHPMSILCHEDQVNMKLENAMSAMPNVTSKNTDQI